MREATNDTLVLKALTELVSAVGTLSQTVCDIASAVDRWDLVDPGAMWAAQEAAAKAVSELQRRSTFAQDTRDAG